MRNFLIGAACGIIVAAIFAALADSSPERSILNE